MAPCAWPGHQHRHGAAPRPRPALPLCTGAARPEFTQPRSPSGNRNVNREEGKKKKNRVIHQGFLQPEGGEGVPSLPDPVAGAPLLAKEIALVGFYYFSSLDFTSFYYLF